MTEHRVVIEDGEMRFVYSDDLRSLLKEGRAEVRRASHVEPHPTKPGWVADMRPSGGGVIGVNAELFPAPENAQLETLQPFETRQEALDAEREWLRKEKGL